MDKFYLLLLFLIVACVSFVNSDKKTKFRFVHTDHTNHKIVKRQASGTTSTPSTTPPPSVNETVTDNHRYYTSKVINDPNGTYWTVLDAGKIHHLSRDSYLRYSYLDFSFKFPFYGHFLKRFAITTGGFLYMSLFFHPDLDLRHSRYIAPLMANFDTLGKGSDIVYQDFGNSFVVEWRNVHLHNEREVGNYTFQTRLYENGTIVFAYKIIPSNDISSTDEGAVKVGVADAYFYDVYNPVTKTTTRYIVRYHAVEKGVDIIKNNMAIIIDPLPTCNLAKSCGECTSLQIGFNCSWCNEVSKCSDGLDRHRQDWTNSGCTSNGVVSSDMCPTTTIPTTTIPTTTKTTTASPTTTPTTTTTTTTPTTTTTTPTTTTTSTTTTTPTTTSTPTTTAAISVITKAIQSPYKQKQKKDKAVEIVVPIVVVLAVIFVIIGVWIFYTRTHPNSPAGQWMIENRPSQLKARLSEKFSNISFSKDKSSGDKVRIG